MKKQSMPSNEPPKQSGEKVGKASRRALAVGLVSVAATLGAAVLLAAMSGPKLPRTTGD